MKIKFGIREKIFLLAIVYLGAGFFWYTSLYLPKSTELKRIKEELKSTQKQCEILSRYIQPASIEEGSIPEKYHELIAKIPERDEVPSAIIQMVRAGQGRNIRILSTDPSTSQLLTTYGRPAGYQLQEIPVEIVLEGRFVNIGRYLFALMNLPFFGGYNSIRLEANEETYPKTRTTIGCMLLFLNTKQIPQISNVN